MSKGRGRKFAVVQVSIWDDPDFTRCTAEAQLVYIMALSHPDLSYCGVMPLLPQRFVLMSANLTERKVRAALKELAEARFLVIDETTAEVLVRTYIRHDGVLKQPNVVKAMNKAYEKVHSATLREVIYDEVDKALLEGFQLGLKDAVVDALREGFAQPLAEAFAEGVA